MRNTIPVFLLMAALAFLAPARASAGIFPAIYSDGGPEIVTVRAYPNPVSELLTVELNQTLDENLVLEVFDMLGKRAQGQPAWTLAAGSKVYSINLGSLPAGIYFVQVRTASGNLGWQQTLKITKVVAASTGSARSPGPQYT